MVNHHAEENDGKLLSHDGYVMANLVDGFHSNPPVESSNYRVAQNSWSKKCRERNSD